MKTRLFIVRHTETIGNVEKRLTGRQDYEITERGQVLIQKLTKELEKIKFDRAYSSTSRRAIKTIEPIVEKQNLKIEESDELCEMYFGIYDGWKWEDVNKIQPEIKQTQNEINEIVGIPGQESMEETANRMYNYIFKIVKENPSDSSSFIAELPEECFVEKKYPIEDFELEVDGDGDYSKVDVDNAITLYEHLCCLPKHVLGDERFWMWLILEKCYAATIQAMPMESGKKIIADHWLFGQGRRRGLMFGALSRAYYRVQLTKDDTLEDAYELTKFATQNYMRYREFTWRGYSNNKTIVTGALKGEKKAIAKYGDTIETIKDYYPSIAKHISQLGSVMLLDFMREDYILDSVLAFCDSLAEANNIMPIK